MIMPLEIKEEKTLKINSIKKDDNLYQIVFSNDKTLICDEALMFEYSLFINKDIPYSIIEILEQKQAYFKVLNRALKIVNTRFYTIKQVKDKLLYENFDLDEVNLVLNKLIEHKILDDDLYYEDYVNFKQNQGYGPLYIKNKLHSLGIDRDVYFTLDKQYEMLKQKSLKLKLNKDVSLIKKSFLTKMKNQGFDVTIIDRVLSELNIENDDTYLRKDYEKLINRYQNKYDEKQLRFVVKKKLYEKGYEIEAIELFLRGMV